MIFEQKTTSKFCVIFFLLEIKFIKKKPIEITKMTNNIMVKFFLNMYLYLFTINNQIGVRELTFKYKRHIP